MIADSACNSEVIRRRRLRIDERLRRKRDSNPQGLTAGDFRGRCLANSAHSSKNNVRPLRIELRSTVPQTAILSVKLWAQVVKFSHIYSIKLLFR